MDAFNFKVKGSKSASPIDRQTSHRLLRSNSLYSLMGRTIDSPISDPLEIDASLIRYSRNTAIGGSLSPSVDFFGSPGIDSGKFHQLLLHNHTNLSSSRGSSSSPLSAIENLEAPSPRSSPLFPSPVKVDEDVLVMDGILVGSSPGSGGRARAVLESSSSPGNSLFKTEICRTWEDSGSCRYGSKCQFAHGKEDLRPTRHAISKSKPEVCKTFAASGSCGYGSKCRFIHHITASSAAAASASASDSSAKKDNWSPADDGIEVLQLPSSPSIAQRESLPPSRDNVEAYISNVLSGSISTRRRRLPVFTEFCPD